MKFKTFKVPSKIFQP